MARVVGRYWLKLWLEILDDPKMGRLPDRAWRRAIELFLMAAECGEDGQLPAVDVIAWRLRCERVVLLEDLETLAGLHILVENDRGWMVRQFAARQASQTGAERQRRYRGRQGGGQQESVTERHESRDESVTSRHAKRHAPCDAPRHEPRDDGVTDSDAPEGEGEGESESTDEAPSVGAMAQPPTGAPNPGDLTVKEIGALELDADGWAELGDLEKAGQHRVGVSRIVVKKLRRASPAVELYRDVVQRYPMRALWPDIEATVGEDPDDLDLWASIIKSWCARGWNPANVAGMLDCFARGEVPVSSGRGRGGTAPETRLDRSLAAVREWRAPEDPPDDP